jgi:hypothetical protein
MVLLAELDRTVVVKTTAPTIACEVVASKVCTLIEFVSCVEVTTSAMISTCIVEVTSVAETSTTTARGVSWYTSADS